jgi:trimethylamine:corrinoid methyltransferase-like protein
MQIGQSYNPATINYNNFEAWIATEANATLEQVTTTQYDEVLATYAPVLPADFEQTHLRKRVALSANNAINPYEYS